jgi:hypothetical protein
MINAAELIIAGLEGVVGVLLSGLKLPTRRGQIEIDHVLISQIGLFTIECKNFSGPVIGTLNGSWYHETPVGPEPIKCARGENPSAQASEQIYAVKNFLTSRLGEDDDLVKKLFVLGAALFPDTANLNLENVPVNAFRGNAPGAFTASGFIAAVRALPNQQKLSLSDVERIVTALQKS